MNVALVTGLVLLGACAHGPLSFRRAESAPSDVIARAKELAAGARFQEADSLLARFLVSSPGAEGAAEAHYWRAVINLDPANARGAFDTGLTSLDAYLGAGGRLQHVLEAAALRRLARSAQQLARVEAALQQARATERREEPDAKSRDEEAVKEIQRLKDELAKANAELERIKKRLAAPAGKP